MRWVTHILLVEQDSTQIYKLQKQDGFSYVQVII